MGSILIDENCSKNLETLPLEELAPVVRIQAKNIPGT